MNKELNTIVTKMRQLNEAIADALTFKQYNQLKVIGKYLWECSDIELYKVTRSTKIIEAVVKGRLLQAEFKTKYATRSEQVC